MVSYSLSGSISLSFSLTLLLPIHIMKAQLYVPKYCSLRMAIDSYYVSWATQHFLLANSIFDCIANSSGSQWCFCIPCLALNPSLLPSPLSTNSSCPTLFPVSFFPTSYPSTGPHLPIYNMKPQHYALIHYSPRMTTNSCDVFWATFSARKLNLLLCSQFSSNQWWFCPPCLALVCFPPFPSASHFTPSVVSHLPIYNINAQFYASTHYSLRVVMIEKSTDIVMAIAQFSWVQTFAVHPFASNISTEFYKHESCGQCTPCHEGTTWMMNMMNCFIEGHRHQHEIWYAPGTNVHAHPIRATLFSALLPSQQRSQR